MLIKHSCMEVAYMQNESSAELCLDFNHPFLLGMIFLKGSVCFVYAFCESRGCGFEFQVIPLWVVRREWSSDLRKELGKDNLNKYK